MFHPRVMSRTQKGRQPHSRSDHSGPHSYPDSVPGQNKQRAASPCRRLRAFLAAGRAPGGGRSLPRAIKGAQAVPWDICSLCSLAGTATRAKGCLLRRAPALPVTTGWPQHAACSRLPWAAQSIPKRKDGGQSVAPLPEVKERGQASPSPMHRALQSLWNWNHMCRGWGSCANTARPRARPGFQAVT